MNSTYLELAIGLALAFFLLSLVASGINEAIVRVLGLRGKYLWAYLRDMLDGPSGGKSRLPADIRDVFLWFPMNKLPTGDTRPQYVDKPPPPAVTDGRTPLADRLHERLREIDRPARRRSVISQIPPNRFAVALMEIISDGSQADIRANVDDFLAGLKAVSSPIYLPIKSLWETANGDLKQFRDGVEGWFDGEMQRLTRLYRRHVKWVITAISAIIALFFSVDSVEYGKALLADDAYRSQVVAVANGNPAALDALQQRCQAQTTPPGGQPADADPYACVTESLSSPAFIKVFQNAPVRVDIAADGDQRWAWNGTNWADRLGPGHWLGLLVTIVAILFGAPFWWDVLRRLSGVKRGGS
jgi:hypothetical protein